MNQNQPLQPPATEFAGDTANENRDPLTGEKGAHPLGTGLGAVIGGAAGAVGTVAAGAVLGPAGVAVGLALGAVAGGYAGKGAAEAINPTDEDPLWREHFEQADWLGENDTFADYEAAFRVGRDGFHRFNNALRFEEVERDLEQDYMNGDGRFAAPWHKARSAARAAWDMEAEKSASQHSEDTAFASAAPTVSATVNTRTTRARADEMPPPAGDEAVSDGPLDVNAVLTPTGDRMPINQPRQEGRL